MSAKGDEKALADSILLNADILSEEFDDEEEIGENVQAGSESTPEPVKEQTDPLSISISIEEERPKYETEKKKKEFSDFTRTGGKKADPLSPEKTIQGKRNGKRIETEKNKTISFSSGQPFSNHSESKKKPKFGDLRTTNNSSRPINTFSGSTNTFSRPTTSSSRTVNGLAGTADSRKGAGKKKKPSEIQKRFLFSEPIRRQKKKAESFAAEKRRSDRINQIRKEPPREKKKTSAIGFEISKPPQPDLTKNQKRGAERKTLMMSNSKKPAQKDDIFSDKMTDKKDMGMMLTERKKKTGSGMETDMMRARNER